MMAPVLPSSEDNAAPPSPSSSKAALVQEPTGVLDSHTLYVPSTCPGSWEPNENEFVDRTPGRNR